MLTSSDFYNSKCESLNHLICTLDKYINDSLNKKLSISNNHYL